jgi:hypothetical protein
VKKFIVVLSALSIILMCTGAIGETIICPSGTTVETEFIYSQLVPKDFPPELSNIFCSIPLQEYATTMHDYPSIVVGLASPTGGIDDVLVYTWFYDTLSQKYIAFTVCENNTHRLLWVSETAPRGFAKYVRELVEKVNSPVEGTF